jgi:TRAP-type mannitol/chloroaromatic compound transport system substrate-binding protein
MTTRLARRRFLAAGAAAPLMAPAVLRAQERHVWRMVTSWPKRLPGPGMSAERVASRIAAMSAGRLTVEVFAAGEIVPALEVLDAVGARVAQMGHTASFYWSGKMPASVFFTTVPFGLPPWEHAAWIELGGGQALWDELYEPFGVKPFAGGNSGMQMGGWFKREISGRADLQGLKLRIAGLGGEVLARLGALPQLTPPAEIYPALQNGVVDGAEFLGPWSDSALALYRIAPFYYWPGFTKPNGTGECLINLDEWRALPDDLKAIVAHACQAEHSFAYFESEWENAKALEQLVGEHDVKLRRWPDDVLAAARQVSDEILAEFEAMGDLERRIHRSFQAARDQVERWSEISAEAFLAARNAGLPGQAGP